MIVLPVMPAEQTASWLALLDLYERLNRGWTLIGGQLVHLHCAERGRFPDRATNDADAVIDVRADPTMLLTFSTALTELGFRSAGVSAEGLQHRWLRDQACLDVLLPEGIGERAKARAGVTGSPTLPTQGGTQALARSQVVAVTVDGRSGHVLRPNLVGALVAKAAAHANTGARDPRRHRRDFLVLAGLITAADFRDETVTGKDRQRLRRMLTAIDKDAELTLELTGTADAQARLRMAAGLD
jgi:hypothetical protein